MRLHNFLRILSLWLIFFIAVPHFALAEGESYDSNLKQGYGLLAAGEWDASEVQFLEVVRSSQVEERIRAYQGLAQLYKTLRMSVKAERILKKLDSEQEFKNKLVPQWDSYYEDYKVKRGDTYLKLALRNKVSLEWLLRINQRKVLIEGDVIRLPKIHYSIIADKESKVLTWKRGSEIMKTYPIAIGAVDTKTPEGEFIVINKVVNPVWYIMGEQYPPDSPKNLLGSRWIGLTQKGYGIHGTRNPNSIGKAASHGCIRMHNRDVEEIFQWIPVGTKVVIR